MVMSTLSVKAPCHRFPRVIGRRSGGRVRRRNAETRKIGGGERGVGVLMCGRRYLTHSCCLTRSWPPDPAADSCRRGTESEEIKLSLNENIDP